MLIRKNARHATAELDSARTQPVALSASRTRNEFKANEKDDALRFCTDGELAGS